MMISPARIAAPVASLLRSLRLVPAGLAVAGLAVGCGPAAAPPEKAASTASQPAEPDDGHGHSHDHGHSHEHGPHGGDLLELGDEEYHAEVVHDEESVTVYVLDGNAKEAVAIDAPNVTINLKQEDRPVQFELPAAPQEKDPAGSASRFVLKNADLAKLVTQAKSEPKLVVAVQGKSYRADIVHAHGHAH